MDWVWLVVSLVVILGGAELFTNGVEWVGEGFGLSEGVVGSVLAAIGTALPETVLPLIAIAVGHSGGKEIGVGAIVGAPLMLTTLAMFILGVTVLGRRRFGVELEADRGVIRHDLAFFLGMYLLAVLAGLLSGWRPLKWALAIVLVLAYGVYVRMHLRAPGEERLERQAAATVKPLYLRSWFQRARRLAVSDPPVGASVGQTLLGLAVIVAGARLFVADVTTLADSLGVPKLAFSLLVAPVATELPEAFNAAVIWARRGKDTLAVGNITGAMVFQSAFPVAIGLLLTPWRLTGDALVAGIVALVGGALLFAQLLARHRFNGRLLLFQGVLYAAFVVYVVVRL